MKLQLVFKLPVLSAFVMMLVGTQVLANPVLTPSLPLPRICATGAPCATGYYCCKNPLSTQPAVGICVKNGLRCQSEDPNPGPCLKPLCKGGFEPIPRPGPHPGPDPAIQQ